jgi:hypothetical protein
MTLMIKNTPNSFTQQLIRECPFLINIELKQIKVWFVDQVWSDSGHALALALRVWAQANLSPDTSYRRLL